MVRSERSMWRVSVKDRNGRIGMERGVRWGSDRYGRRGWLGQERRGGDRRGWDRRGAEWQAGIGKEWCVEAGTGSARYGRRGTVGSGRFWYGSEGAARNGLERKRRAKTGRLSEWFIR